MLDCAATTTPDGRVILARPDLAGAVEEVVELAGEMFDADDKGRRGWVALLRRWAPGRGHVTVWSDDAWRDLARLEPDDEAATRGAGAKVGAGYLVAATWGRVHLRDTRAWGVADWPLDWRDRLAAILRWRVDLARVCEGLGAPARGTAAAWVHEAWRGSAPAWRTPAYADTGTLDRWRAGLYGARCGWRPRRPEDAEATPGARGAAFPGWWGGLIVEAGAKLPALHGPTGAPVLRLRPGWTLRRYDVRSAYPWAWSLGAFPRVHRPPLLDTGADVLARAGLVDATVRAPTSGAPRLPVHVGRYGRIKPADLGRRQPCRTDWPESTGFTVRGLYLCSTLREVVRAGGAVEAIHAAETWPEVYDCAGGFADQLHAAMRATASPEVRASLKAGERRIYGRFAADRRDGTWRDIRSEAVGIAPAGGWTWRGGVTRRGVYVYQEIDAPEYPVHAQPLWAAEITARCAIALSRAEDEIEASGARTVYADTDSLLVAHPADWTPPARFTRAPDSLGGWREDWRGRWVYLAGAKWYVLEGRSPVLAGVPSEAANDLARFGEARALMSGVERRWRWPQWHDE